MGYASNKKWRQANPKLRQAQNKRNYGARRFGNKRPWSAPEEAMLLKYEALPDVELAAIMKRSVQAIQIKRSRIKNGRYGRCPECGELFDDNRMCSAWRKVAIPPQFVETNPRSCEEDARWMKMINAHVVSLNG